MTDLAQPRSEVPGAHPIYLDITGMSCGMCSGRVQRALNKVDGVRAKVSLATKTATIETAGDISVDELCAVVREAGYGAELRAGAPVEEAPAARGWWQQLFGRIASR